MQKINFYFEEYHPKPLSFDSRFAAFIIVISFIGMLIIGWVQSIQVSDLEERQATQKTKLEQMQGELASVQKELASQIGIEDLQNEVNIRQTELNSYRKVISLVNLPVAREPVKFSDVLSDLSVQTVDALWLTKISIVAQNLSLSGATTETRAIPQYVEALKQSKSLNRQFDELKVQRDNINSYLVSFQLLNGGLTND